MNKFNKFLAVALMGVTVAGCSCSNDECKCPSDTGNGAEMQGTLLNGYAEQYKESVESVVMVKMQKKNNGEVKFTGSGVVFFEEGQSAYIITNAHVLKDFSNSFEVEVHFSNSEGELSGKSEIAKVHSSYIDYYEDIAVLEINKSTKYKVAKIGDSDNLDKGDGVYTIGSPLQIFNHITDGVISNYNHEIAIDMSNSQIKTNVYAILTNAPLNNGNSGGGLFNSKGELIGITTFKYNKISNSAEALEDQNTTLTDVFGALPINHAIKVAKHLISSTQDYTRPNLSLTMLSINKMGASRENYGISSNIYTGVYVQNSTEANIPVQTIITKVNNVIVDSKEELMVQILKYKIGDTVTLTIMNKDGMNERTVNVTLHA